MLHANRETISHSEATKKFINFLVCVNDVFSVFEHDRIP